MTENHGKASNSDATESGGGEENARQDRESARRRTLLKAGWALPVVTMVPLPQESAMAQTGGTHNDHTDTSHVDSHNDG